MTISDLIEKVKAKNKNLSADEVGAIVRLIFQTIEQRVVDGGKAEFRNFGSFSSKKSKDRMGKNPKTGEDIELKAKNYPVFKAGKLLNKRLNDKS